MLLRVDTAYRDEAARAGHPIRVGVALPINEPTDRGWPSGPEGEELQVAEDEVVRLVADRAVLVAVITGKNVRELVLQARDSEWVAEFHRAADEAIATHEVQVIAETDPDWEVYRSLLPDA
jgi:hypothetical protein